MKKLRLLFNGWGERWPLGVLADTGRALMFEYSEEAVARGLRHSPMHHPLPRAGAAALAFRGEPYFYGLPGFVADALPDGWGMLLMDRALRRAGRDPKSVSVLERLAILGERAMGALSFEPADSDVMPEEILQLKALAKSVAQLQGDDENKSAQADQQLTHLLRLGGSPQGARPKILANYSTRTGLLSSAHFLSRSATPWLIKFPAQGEHKEVCAIEELYARIARHGGLSMPKSRFFDLGGAHSAFGVERFDRTRMDASVWRVPMMSISAYLQTDFRLPSLDYETVLLATLHLTGDQRELLKAFERCVYNVLLHNRDDHGRNFAYVMDERGMWTLSPIFDLTLSDGPRGEHSTSVLGYGGAITREIFMELAKRTGVPPKHAVQCIDHANAAINDWPKLVRGLPIRKATQLALGKRLSQLRV